MRLSIANVFETVAADMIVIRRKSESEYKATILANAASFSAIAESPERAMLGAAKIAIQGTLPYGVIVELEIRK